MSSARVTWQLWNRHWVYSEGFIDNAIANIYYRICVNLHRLCEPTQTVRTYTDCANLHRLCEPTQTVWIYRLCEPTQTVWTYTDCVNLQTVWTYRLCEPTQTVWTYRLCEPTQTVWTYTDCVNLHRLCEPTQTVWTYTNCVNLHKLCELTELCRMQESYRIVEMITSCWAVFEPAGLSPKWICCSRESLKSKCPELDGN